MKIRNLLIIAVFIIVIASVGVWLWQTQAASAQADSPLEATGTIETTEIAIAPELGGRVVEVLAEEGDTLAEGQTLVQLDGALLEAQRAQADAAVAAAQAQRQMAEANYDLLRAGAQPDEIDAAREAVSAAEAGVAGAQAQLARLQSGAQAADIAAAEAAVAQTAAQLKVAQDTHDQTLKCVEVPLPGGSTQEVCPGLGTREEQARAALNAAQEAYAAAQARLAQLNTGATADDLNAARAALAAAQAQQAMAEDQLSLLENGARPEQLDAARAQVAAAQAQEDAAHAALRLIDVQIGKLTLRAPSAGLVLSRAVESGEIAAPGATLLTIGRLDWLKLTVYLPEDQFGKVTPGQAVNVRVDSYPDRAFTGRVLRVSNQAEFTPANIQTKDDRTRLVYAVVIGIDNPDLALKPGMIADVEFEP